MKTRIGKVALLAILTTSCLGMFSRSAIARPVVASKSSIKDIGVRGIPIHAVNLNNETLALDSKNTYNYNLKVSKAIKLGDTYIPAGSIIHGHYQPASGGLNYVAETIDIHGRTSKLDASSEPIAGSKKPGQRGTIIKDAGIGAAGSTALEALFSHHTNVAGIIGGAAAGGAIGAMNTSRAVEIKPWMPISLYIR